MLICIKYTHTHTHIYIYIYIYISCCLKHKTCSTSIELFPQAKLPYKT